MEENFQQPTSSTEKSVKIPEHLQALTENVSDNLTFSQRSDIGKVISEYADVFVGPDGKLEGQTWLNTLFLQKPTDLSQRGYCTTYRELLAVVTFVKQFRFYLSGRHFLLRTDHSSLTWLKNFKEPEGMVARWLALLDTYVFKIEHRKGTLHGNADALSRRPRRRCKRDECLQCQNGSECEVNVNAITRSHLTQSDASTSKTVTPPESTLNDRSKRLQRR
ncbi:unnamed protein product [Mytilus coruscus]|uniref:Reverse transcriptase RNase H-like domain-containing protein n=1 Tax=Mytilus coruscus TaxID=42192 RepID=A0A6J8DJE6_MYTCO|nr:unnamed protein product [Mytilus coruscus]